MTEEEEIRWEETAKSGRIAVRVPLIRLVRMNAVFVKDGSSWLLPSSSRVSKIGLIESVSEGAAVFEASWETRDVRLGVAAPMSDEASTSIGRDPVRRDDAAPFDKFEDGVILPWRFVGDCST